MPQLFQVLRCFKCAVFQVHQTKKSNRWECKLCGEKQSIKRHYGLGTGKECRLHVQKLNGIRGQIDEIAQPNESDDEVPAEDVTSVLDKKDVNNLKSKWTDFVDKTEDVKTPESESMYLGNAEVVLEVPVKQRKFAKPKVTKNALASSAYPVKTNCFGYVQESPETQMSNVKKNLHKMDDTTTTTNKTSTDHLVQVTSRQTEFEKPIVEMKTFVPHKVHKNSKWMQYADESEEVNYCGEKDLSFTLCDDEKTVTNNTDYDVDLEISNDESREKIQKELPNNLFSLCNEDDLDDVLDI